MPPTPFTPSSLRIPLKPKSIFWILFACCFLGWGSSSLLAQPEETAAETEQAPDEKEEQTETPEETDGEASSETTAEVESPSEPEPTTGPRELFELMGIDDSVWETFEDGQAIDAREQEAFLRTLYAVRRFKEKQIEAWTPEIFDAEALAENPTEQRGTLWPLVGRVSQTAATDIPPEFADRFSISKVFTSQMELANGQTALIYSLAIPKAWRTQTPVPPVEWQAKTTGFYLKQNSQGAPVFLAREFAWYPSGMLSFLSIDSAVFDQVRIGGQLSHRDADAFYALLQASSRARQGYLERMSEVVEDGPDFQLPHIRDWITLLWKIQRASKLETPSPARQIWNHLDEPMQAMIGGWEFGVVPPDENREAFLTALNEMLAAEDLYQPEAWKSVLYANIEKPQLALPMEDHALLRKWPDKLSPQEMRQFNRAMLEEAFPNQIARSREHSVFPLFFNPPQQQGRLFRIRGDARRAVKIFIDDPELEAKLGFDHYYELLVFTDDSQGRPIAVCVREIPEKMPQGEELHEQVDIPAFFLKIWQYRINAPADSKVAEGKNSQGRDLYNAPLLIGKEVIWTPRPSPAANPLYGYLAAGAFILTLIAICLGLARSARQDEAFERQTLSRQFELEEGVSLNEVVTETVDGPDFSHLEEADRLAEEGAEPPAPNTEEPEKNSTEETPEGESSKEESKNESNS
ncbi:Hypothetical protein PBC10988_14920 [Planctomycetales bacterium 10988]|nr:Hypothetical protein PBC10988_14920 [Planctomycetales bacterium 10988]